MHKTVLVQIQFDKVLSPVLAYFYTLLRDSWKWGILKEQRSSEHFFEFMLGYNGICS